MFMSLDTRLGWMDWVGSDGAEEHDFFLRFFFPSPLPICSIVFELYLLHDSFVLGRNVIFLMHELD